MNYERPPTPAGWSDTDWIKHLQDRKRPFDCSPSTITAMQAQLAERDKTILEQQARIAEVLELLNSWYGYVVYSPTRSLPSDRVDGILERRDNISALEAALKAERIKTLEDAATKIESGCLDSWFDGEYARELRRMANELKEQK